MAESTGQARGLGWAIWAVPYVGAVLASQSYRHPDEGGIYVLLALLLLPLVSAVLILLDGQRHGTAGLGFAGLTCAFWILLYPIYLRIRDRAEGTKHHLPVGLIGVLLLVLAGYWANEVTLDAEASCSFAGRDVVCQFRNPGFWLARGGVLVKVQNEQGDRSQTLGVYTYRPIEPYGERQVSAEEMMGSVAEGYEALMTDLCGAGPDPSERCTLSWKPLPPPP